VIGCVVNGPGEALVSDIGLTGGDKRSMIYMRGKLAGRVENMDIVDTLEREIRARIAARKTEQ